MPPTSPLSATASPAASSRDLPEPGGLCAIHQPNFLPRLTTLAKLFAADYWIVLDDVQFTRRDYQHRARLAALDETRPSAVAHHPDPPAEWTAHPHPGRRDRRPRPCPPQNRRCAAAALSGQRSLARLRRGSGSDIGRLRHEQDRDGRRDLHPRPAGPARLEGSGSYQQSSASPVGPIRAARRPGRSDRRARLSVRNRRHDLSRPEPVRGSEHRCRPVPAADHRHLVLGPKAERPVGTGGTGPTDPLAARLRVLTAHDTRLRAAV